MPPRAGDNAAPKLALIGLRYDENSSFLQGAAEAPPLIREAFASESSNRWSESGSDLTDAFFDAGDLGPGSGGGMAAQIEEAISDLLERGFFPIALGGDHSITYPILRAFARTYPRLTVLHFDAHPDLYDDFRGNRYSHASPFARIMEEGLAQRLVQVGIRACNGHQRKQAERFGVEMIEMRGGREGAELRFDSPVYISFDLDALDPAYAPGVSHREPGGLSTRQAIDRIQGIQAPVVGADIVEFNPRRDPTGMTASVCSKLLKEIAARILESAP